jgi:hypothetical protein
MGESLDVGVPIRVTRSNRLPTYQPGDTGQIVAVEAPPHDDRLLYACEMDGRAPVWLTVFYEEEIEPIRRAA